MRFIFLLFTLLFPLFSYPEGFGGDTKVLIQDGYAQIKILNSRDSVVCFDEQGSFIDGTISNVLKSSEQQLIVLSVGEEKIITTKGQRFFSAKSMDWIGAEEIVAGDKLLSLDGKDVEVDLVEVCDKPCDIYKISVDDYSNFFVTSKNILVHNYADIFYEAAAYAAENYPVIEDAVASVVSIGTEYLARGNQSQNKQSESDAAQKDKASSSEAENEKDQDDTSRRQIKEVDRAEIIGDENKRHHIFDDEKHRFGEFGVGVNDDSEEVFGEIVDKVIEKDKQGEVTPANDGKFTVEVEDIRGHPVGLDGIIVDGKFKVGTAYIPKDYVPEGE